MHRALRSTKEQPRPRRLIEQTVDSDPTPLKVSFGSFLDWHGEGSRGERVDGEVLPFMAPSRVHQQLMGSHHSLLWTYADLRRLGTVMLSPFGMRLRDGQPFREPDLVFVAKEHGDRLTAQWLQSPTDLVTELVSDDSVIRDGRDRHAEYAILV